MGGRVSRRDRGGDEQGWRVKNATVKVRAAENPWSLIPVRHHPNFVTTTVKTASFKPSTNSVSKENQECEYMNAQKPVGEIAIKVLDHHIK